MRGFATAVVLLIVAAACSRNDAPPAPLKTGYAPKDAPERATLPPKCKDALSFDDECRALFDEIWGVGAGASEKANLNIKRASAGWGEMRSDVKPAAQLGLGAPQQQAPDSTAKDN